MGRGIHRVAKDMLRESKGFKFKDEDSWWEVGFQEKVTVKRDWCKAQIWKNKVVKKDIKKALAFKGFYHFLGTKDGKNIFIGLLNEEKGKQVT